MLRAECMVCYNRYYMLHRKAEIERLETELTQARSDQTIAHNQLVVAAERLISNIHTDLTTDRSNVVPRLDMPLAELKTQLALSPRHHRADYLLAARCLDGDMVRFTSNAALSDHLHTLEFQAVPLTSRRRPMHAYKEQLTYRRASINVDSQVVPAPIEMDSVAEMVTQPSFLAHLGRAATLLQLVESGAITIQPLDRSITQ